MCKTVIAALALVVGVQFWGCAEAPPTRDGRSPGTASAEPDATLSVSATVEERPGRTEYKATFSTATKDGTPILKIAVQATKYCDKFENHVANSSGIVIASRQIGSRECDAGPAVGLALTLRNGGGRDLDLVTDKDGIVEADEGQLRATLFNPSYVTPQIVIAIAKQSATATDALDSMWSGWIKKGQEAQQRDEEKLRIAQKAQSIELLTAAKKHMGAHEFVGAVDKATKCIAIDADNADCAKIKAEAERQRDAAQIKQLLGEAQKQLQAKQFEEAGRSAQQCLQIDEGNIKCKVISSKLEQIEQAAERKRLAAHEKEIKAAVAKGLRALSRHEPQEARDAVASCLSDERCQQIEQKLKPHHIKDFAITEEGGGYVVYFSLVNSDGDYVTETGGAVIGFEFMNDGMAMNKAAVDKVMFSASDFKSVTLGLGGFSRKAVVYSKYYDGDEFFSHIGFARGAGRVAFNAFSRDADETYLTVFFIAKSGGQALTARTRFNP